MGLFERVDLCRTYVLGPGRVAAMFDMQRRVFLSSGLALAAANVFPWLTKAEGSDVLLWALNARRQDIGIAPLLPDPALTKMAQKQALYMQRIGRAMHTDPNGSDPIERGIRSGYDGRILGETLAESVEGPVGTFELWMYHDQTRAVLLDSEARYVGLSGIGDQRGDLVHWDLVVGA